MIAEYLGKIGYKEGKAMQGFLISMSENIESIKKINKKIALLGCGENALYAEKLLNNFGIEVDYYADSSNKIQGKQMGGGKTVLSPYRLFDQDVYFIITVASRNINCARLQFMTHGIESYSVFLNCLSGDFGEESIDLQNKIMESINEIVFVGEDPEDALPLIGIAEGSNGAQLGNLNWLLNSWGWSKLAFEWEQKIIEEMSVENILEIGPGFGLMSLVLLKKFNDIFIDWIIYGDRDYELTENAKSKYEKSLWKIKKVYKDRVNVQYGYIERENFAIEAKYDLIIMTEVFEHFALNPVNTMRKLNNMLKDEGKVVLTTPNWGHLHIYETWRELPDAEDVDDKKYAKLRKCGHVYQYSKNELYEIFDNAGFNVDKYDVTASNHHSFILSKRMFY